jgi:hypothetical protein
MKSYGADRASGKDSEMECRCAREEYYAESEKLAYNQLQCEGLGNFNSFQSFENGRESYCVDEDGSRISKVEPTQCLDKFRKFDTGILKENVCKAMRRSLTDMAMTLGKAYVYERETDSFSEMESKPGEKEMFDCNKSYIP